MISAIKLLVFFVNNIIFPVFSEKVTVCAIEVSFRVVQDEECSLRHIRDRVALVGLAAVLAVTNTVDALLGHAELLVELVTFGRVQIENAETSRRRYGRLFQIVRQSFVCLMSALHPRSALMMYAQESIAKTCHIGQVGGLFVPGRLSAVVIGSFIRNCAVYWDARAGFFAHQVTTRLMGAVLCLALLVSRVVELIYGVFFALVAVCSQRSTFRMKSVLYCAACLQLTPAIPFDLAVGFAAIIAPHQLERVLNRCGVIGRNEYGDMDRIWNGVAEPLRENPGIAAMVANNALNIVRNEKEREQIIDTLTGIVNKHADRLEGG